jgi:hypothetical protein
MTDVIVLIVRCPYSLLGDNFRPMLQRPQWFICEQCGHEMLPDDLGFKCSCQKCAQSNRAA